MSVLAAAAAPPSTAFAESMAALYAALFIAACLDRDALRQALDPRRREQWGDDAFGRWNAAAEATIQLMFFVAPFAFAELLAFVCIADPARDERATMAGLAVWCFWSTLAPRAAIVLDEHDPGMGMRFRVASALIIGTITGGLYLTT